MDRLDLKFSLKDGDFLCLFSDTNSLQDDLKEAQMDHTGDHIVEHLAFEPDNMDGEAVLDIIDSTVDLEKGVSTFEKLAGAIFKSGVNYGREHAARIKVSDL
ncbi:MAG: hypothetical protein C3F02_02295 [Parcubacteria group bacterium]|nr:MAG: hypothetical protein C3F02_02295 [Parcubacteria group bacterium]